VQALPQKAKKPTNQAALDVLSGLVDQAGAPEAPQQEEKTEEVKEKPKPVVKAAPKPAPKPVVKQAPIAQAQSVEA